ncbi:MAG: hypothetical protein KF691_11620 [Phycisphaeraceae bacterium]|nr:hypothetical protein [Phycisphaeraceae bacterium]
MLEPIRQDLQDDPKALSPLVRERRDAMLPGLLEEVRRVRRRRVARRVGSLAAAVALISGILALALFRTSPTAVSQPIAKATSDKSPGGARVMQAPGPIGPHVEIVQSSPDVLERLSVRAPALVHVQYISTDEALALLQSTGDRYGIIEIAGRVEFVAIAKK